MTDMPCDASTAKRQMREKLRFRRRHFAANLDSLSRLAAFKALPASLVELVEKAAVVGAYAHSGDEPDVLHMLGHLSFVALPFHSARDAPMEFRRTRRDAPLEIGPWGTLQPPCACELVTPDVIFCPLVGFDRRGGRLGQGGGHYDRYLADHPLPVRIGVGWSVQEVDSIVAESTDATLDAVLTEQELIICGDRL